MMDHLPTWVAGLFVLAFLATLVFFYLANGRPRTLLTIIIIWSLGQAVLAYQGFYLITDTIPPRFALVLLPATILMIYGFTRAPREQLLAQRSLTWSTLLHVVRIPVEIVLWQLFIAEMVPELMTFEGRNFDIIAGLTAPVIAWLYAKGQLSTRALLVWNVIGLCLVSFILVNGILSAELPIQQFAFDQPNRALNYSPFVLLPATIVPVVMYTHITDIILLRRLLKK